MPFEGDLFLSKYFDNVSTNVFCISNQLVTFNKLIGLMGSADLIEISTGTVAVGIGLAVL